MEQVHVMMFVCGSEYGLKIMHFLKALLFHRSTHIHFHFVADKDARPVLKQECVLTGRTLPNAVYSKPTRGSAQVAEASAAGWRRFRGNYSLARATDHHLSCKDGTFRTVVSQAAAL
jgi:hypothetical protein